EVVGRHRLDDTEMADAADHLVARIPWPHGADRPDDGVPGRHDVPGEDAAQLGLRLPPCDAERLQELRIGVEVLGLLAGEGYPLHEAGEPRPLMRRREGQKA